MYRVLLVEDEPPAIRQMKLLIEKYCEKFEVVGEAENGLEGIEKVEKLQPDVVITDVQMPLMDGIEFVSRIKREMPDMVFLIVSGFSEFEYAKAAISYGVNDYLLKPVVPSELAASMEKIEKLLEKDFYKNRNYLLTQMADENFIDATKVRKYFPYDKYYMSVIRVKGTPGRFKPEGKLEIYSEQDETIAVYGRDYNEGLYLIPYEVIEGSDIKMFHRKIIKQYQGIGVYFTFVYLPGPIGVTEIPKTMKALYRILDKRVVIGQTQMINGMEEQETESELDSKDVNKVLERTDYICRKNEYGKLRNELFLLFEQWRQESRTQAYVEYMMKQILYSTAKYNREGTDNRLLEAEDILEEILASAGRLEDVRDGFLDILFQNLQNPVIEKVDTPEFLDTLKEYVSQHIAEEISLTGICSIFGVSQPYFSKIFRKYTNKSFNQYITEERMEKAKEIMSQNKDMLVKDVALQVGYSNQFYFSRIFHAYTRMSPTEYFDMIS